MSICRGVQPEGPEDNRGGHNVYDNAHIFNIPQSQDGAVRPRKDLKPGWSVRGPKKGMSTRDY